MLHIKIETFSLDAIKTRLRDEFNTSYAISAFEFQFFLRIVLFCQWRPQSPQIFESRVTLPFHPSNRTKR